MVNYQLSKIYKLTTEQTDDIYIGSTKGTLSNRKAHHKSSYKHYIKLKRGNFITSFNIIKYDDCKIVLIENFPCNSKKELLTRERYWIEKIECVNKCKPIITKEERIEYVKKWHIDNKEKISLYKQQYHEDNKELISKNKKKKYEDNKKKILIKAKQYRENNSEKIKIYQQKKKTCECGLIIGLSNLSRHLKSKTHLKNIEI